MHWFMSFGQIVAGVLGIISALWMIGGSILLVLKVLARNEYSVDGDNWTSDPRFEGEKIIYRS
jgi:hypothetical protein